MSEGKRIRRGISGWQKLFSRQARSGMTDAEFCKRRGINVALFRCWQVRLGEPSAVVRSCAADKPAVTAPFIDLGDLRSSGPRLEVRLDLGDGMVLSIARS